MRENDLFRGTILVADDDQAVRDTLQHLLRTHRYRVLVAGDGEEALALLQTHPIDLALFGATMPKLTGLGVCRAAKARPETRLTPIVLLTGRGAARTACRPSARAQTIL